MWYILMMSLINAFFLDDVNDTEYIQPISCWGKPDEKGSLVEAGPSGNFFGPRWSFALNTQVVRRLVLIGVVVCQRGDLPALLSYFLFFPYGYIWQGKDGMLLATCNEWHSTTAGSTHSPIQSPNCSACWFFSFLTPGALIFTQWPVCWTSLASMDQWRGRSSMADVYTTKLEECFTLSLNH